VDPFPSIGELDQLPEQACAAALASVFGQAPALLTAIVAARPFGDDDELIATAYRVVRELPESDVVVVVTARLHGTSAVRLPEHEAEASDEQEDDASAEGAWVEEELAGLEEVYLARFGFPYTVFDTGRPRAELIPLLEAGLRNDREAELRRAGAECVALAADRLRAMRGRSPGSIEDAE
jgi:2-oxo-4-hydroxy-4-carboxy--5-ureidoimidazoline (OHCU) decarboxylase